MTLLNFDTLYFEVERFKRQRVWHNLNVTKNGIRKLLSDSTWYTLYLPSSRLEPSDFAGVALLQQVAIELLKKYCDRLYNYRKREYIEPRLELRDLEPSDSNFPGEDEYQLIVDGDENQLIQAIKQIKRDLETRKDDLLRIGDLCACSFAHHLYQPLFHVRRGGKITILPVALNESEYQFVSDLKAWCNENYQSLTGEGVELFLLRNMSRGKGVGFFEASSFHPDFILWLLEAGKQYITFVEPHGLHHEGPGSDKILFHRRIKDVENRIGDSDVILNSAILSWTQYPQLRWGLSREELETMNVLFMKEDRDHYVPKLLALAKT